MYLTFEEWLDQNRQNLIDFYYEGTCVDQDMLTRIEDFARRAYEAGKNNFIERLYEEGGT